MKRVLARLLLMCIGEGELIDKRCVSSNNYIKKQTNELMPPAPPPEPKCKPGDTIKLAQRLNDVYGLRKSQTFKVIKNELFRRVWSYAVENPEKHRKEPLWLLDHDFEIPKYKYPAHPLTDMFMNESD